MSTRKLIVSLLSAYNAMRRSYLTKKDLRTALFYLDCDPANFFYPKKEIGPKCTPLYKLVYHDNPHRGKRHHLMLKKAVKKAEQEGRLIWRKGENNFSELHSLLNRAGYMINLRQWDEENVPFLFSTVREKLKKQLPNIEVIFGNYQ